MSERSKNHWQFHINLSEYKQRSELVQQRLALGEQGDVLEQLSPIKVKCQPVDLSHLSQAEHEKLRKSHDPELFQDKSYTTLLSDKIHVKEDASVRQVVCRIPARLLPALKEELEVMEEVKVTEPKPASGAVQLCWHQNGWLDFDSALTLG